MAMIYEVKKNIQEEIRDNLAILGFGRKLVDVQFIGTDESMHGIQHYGIITQWKGHPAYGDIFMAGIVTRYISDSGIVDWRESSRKIFQEQPDHPVYTPASLATMENKIEYSRQVWEHRALKQARIWLYELIAVELRNCAWDVESRRD